MAINVVGTKVIDAPSSSPYLYNIVNAEGTYGNWEHSCGTTTGVTSININLGSTTVQPLNEYELGGNTTVTLSNSGLGRTYLLLIDGSSTGYDITWPSTVKWPNDTEPTWTGARYWQVHLICYDASTIFATATSWGS
jgi:hypothetical protein